ncbi:MAG TPA: DUF1611 domain-containing protein [Candidatus Obscuribacterales bacterium]
MYYSQNARLAIYAEGEFGKSSKTAEGVLRYAKNPVVAVIDSRQAGKTVQEVTGIPCQVPIVGSLGECLSLKPDALLLGSAWQGGALPPQWRPDILQAIASGLDIINGLHDFLVDDPEIATAAKSKQSRLLDVRRTPEKLPIASGRAVTLPSYIVLTVGSDCSVGKMTVSLELTKVAHQRGKTAKFVATGQTGIMIAGEGIAIDRVIGDFMAGATEQMVVEASPNSDYVFVEGQGSIVHPGFSGVTLALLHGSCPQAMILVHNPQRDKMKDTDFRVIGLKRLIEMYEQLAQPMRPSKVVGVALNTRGMDEAQAQAAIKRAADETGLPSTDAVRYGADKLFDAILSYQEKTR